jgi:malonyl-CoA decarboxylase
LGLARFIGLSSRPGTGAAQPGSHTVRQALVLCRDLLSERGDNARLAQDALEACRSLRAAEQTEFFDLLGSEFSPDPEEVGRYADVYRKEPTPANLTRLQDAVEPPRQDLFRRLNLAPGGTRALIEMRAQMLTGLPQHPQWSAAEADLAHLLTDWFNRAFLVLRRIDWHTPAIILEKLIEYEAVHQIQGWRDLRRRLQADRRCYAFFHPALPDEPIIFVEVALLDRMSARVQPLLDPDSPITGEEAAKSAVFYSITNCQDGLRGVPFGSLLIQMVADELRRELPKLKTFATLSPIPGFMAWLSGRARHHENGPQDGKLSSVLEKVEAPRWFADKDRAGDLQKDLLPLCAYYLLQAKHGQEPLDPVARFHLRNGARLERLNWLGDTSPTGIQRSAGLTVNYLYRLEDLDRNHRLYTQEHRVQASYSVERLARQSLLSRESAASR